VRTQNRPFSERTELSKKMGSGSTGFRPPPFPQRKGTAGESNDSPKFPRICRTYHIYFFAEKIAKKSSVSESIGGLRYGATRPALPKTPEKLCVTLVLSLTKKGSLTHRRSRQTEGRCLLLTFGHDKKPFPAASQNFWVVFRVVHNKRQIRPHSLSPKNFYVRCRPQFLRGGVFSFLRSEKSFRLLLERSK
jgi:hypothetical protein